MKKENKDIRVSKEVALAILGIIFMAANLRAPLTSVGPVISQISQAFHISNTTAGLLTTIPLMSFGLLSGIVPRFAIRYGIEKVLYISLIILVLGLVIRPLGYLASLFLGTILIGVAITGGNVLMPPFIKNKFPDHTGLMTGIYSVSMNLTAALATGFSINMGKITGLGWRGSLGIWLILSIATVFIWTSQVNSKTSNNTSLSTKEPQRNILKSSVAWAVTIFMGTQSLLFYCLAAWLPKVLQHWGMHMEDAGWTLSYVQFAQLPMTFAGALLATRFRNQKFLAILVGALFMMGITGILLFHTKYVIVWAIMIGIASGLAFSLSMMFFVLRTRSSQEATKLSGMAQGFGYLIAAGGPALFGAFYDITHAWDLSLLFLLLAAVVVLISGIFAGRDAYV